MAALIFHSNTNLGEYLSRTSWFSFIKSTFHTTNRIAYGSSWHNLPGDIVEMIEKHLSTETDLIRMSSVWKWWRANKVGMAVEIPWKSSSWHNFPSEIVEMIEKRLSTQTDLIRMSSVCKKEFIIQGCQSQRLEGSVVAVPKLPLLSLTTIPSFVDRELAITYFVKSVMVSSADAAECIVAAILGDDEDEDIDYDYRLSRYWHTTGFEIFKINPNNGNCDRLNNLADHKVLFLDDNDVSFSARDSDGIHGNFIYFASYHFPSIKGHCWPSHECGVFYLEGGRIEHTLPNMKPGEGRSWFTANF
ncbi:unnamed protein product [Ilex paraguariensis]|uniref:KIB1-4 beta-propeller domain-containing protein n=1 Tax=Ilex paraguariensis TaxID=185542 RepID=A0ABC8S2B7_9AQUA